MRWLPFSSSHNNHGRHNHDDEHSRLFGKISRPIIRQRNLSAEDMSSVSTRAFRTLERNEHYATGLTKARSLRPIPQPLPLPEFERRRKDSELPSPEQARDRCSTSVSPPGNSRYIRVHAHQDARTLAQYGDAHPSNIARQDTNGTGGLRDNCNAGIPVISAPTSPYSSPACSPPSLYYPIEPRGKHVWSAPEMPFYDTVLGTSVSGISNRSHSDLTSGSNDCSPLQSPPARSPPPNPSSSANSPVHPNLCSDPLSSRHENIHINVHPLPLPPGATSSLSSPPTKTDTLPMVCQWQKGKLIGRGTFGSVYVATNRKTGALCAMKEVEMCSDDPKSAECIKQLQQEIKVLSQLKHPNIVRYYGSEIVDDKFYIYLEYVHPGSINKYVRENCGAITESVVRCFTRHILRGLAYLHSKKTIHRDIKGANLLVDSCGVVKLADFGMAKHLTGQRADLSLKGSPYWMAPELMQAVMQKDNSSDLALAVDIWSLGCTIVEMLTGKPPWSEYEGAAAMFKVMKDTPPIPNILSPEGKDFLKLCFCRNPAARPSAAVLLDHRFLRD